MSNTKNGIFFLYKIVLFISHMTSFAQIYSILNVMTIYNINLK